MLLLVQVRREKTINALNFNFVWFHTIFSPFDSLKRNRAELASKLFMETNTFLPGSLLPRRRHPLHGGAAAQTGWMSAASKQHHRSCDSRASHLSKNEKLSSRLRAQRAAAGPPKPQVQNTLRGQTLDATRKAVRRAAPSPG